MYAIYGGTTINPFSPCNFKCTDLVQIVYTSPRSVCFPDSSGVYADMQPCLCSCHYSLYSRKRISAHPTHENSALNYIIIVCCWLHIQFHGTLIHDSIHLASNKFSLIPTALLSPRTSPSSTPNWETSQAPPSEQFQMSCSLLASGQHNTSQLSGRCQYPPSCLFQDL